MADEKGRARLRWAEMVRTGDLAELRAYLRGLAFHAVIVLVLTSLIVLAVGSALKAMPRNAAGAPQALYSIPIMTTCVAIAGLALWIRWPRGWDFRLMWWLILTLGAIGAIVSAIAAAG